MVGSTVEVSVLSASRDSCHFNWPTFERDSRSSVAETRFGRGSPTFTAYLPVAGTQ